MSLRNLDETLALVFEILLRSILNQRLLEHVNSLNILHNSQIGFLHKKSNSIPCSNFENSGRYIRVSSQRKNLSACFVDFKKAFDSVWHDGLLFKLLQINVVGCFFNLIKSLYSNSSWSIKIGQNQTGPFPYLRGVRQSCILNPLQFNLFKMIYHSLLKILSDPFVLPNSAELNSLLYADDVVILSRSKIGLQNCRICAN